MDLSNLRRWFPDANRTGGVRAVAVPKAAEVQDNRVARLDHSIPGFMVRVGPIRTRSDHSEVDLLMAELPQQISKISRDLRLAPTSKTPLHNLAISRVRRGPGGGEA